MFGLGPTELIIIAGILLFLFGAKKLPEIGKGLGGAIREFKKVKRELRPQKRADDNQKQDNAAKNMESPALEEKVVNKVLDQMPGIKKVMEIKKTLEK